MSACCEGEFGKLTLARASLSIFSRAAALCFSSFESTDAPGAKSAARFSSVRGLLCPCTVGGTDSSCLAALLATCFGSPDNADDSLFPLRNDPSTIPMPAQAITTPIDMTDHLGFLACLSGSIVTASSNPTERSAATGSGVSARAGGSAEKSCSRLSAAGRSCGSSASALSDGTPSS